MDSEDPYFSNSYFSRPVYLPNFPRGFYDGLSSTDSVHSYSTSSDRPYTMNPGDAGYNSLPSEPRHPGEVVVPEDETGLTGVRSRSRTDHTGRGYARPPSPYVKARRVEARRTERRTREGGWPARGSSDPHIAEDYTEDSHERLSGVADNSAFEWGVQVVPGEMRDAERSRRNSDRRDRHKGYATDMGGEREKERKREREKRERK